MKKKHITKLFLLLILISLPILGFGCKGGDKAAQKAAQPVTIKFWGVWDEEDYWKEIFSDYKQSHPNVKFEYRKLRIEEYERALLEAWAEDRGPDIFMLHNTWIRGYQNKLEPLPTKITLPAKEVQGSIKKEIVWVMKEFPTITTAQVEEKFVDIVAEDIIVDNQIYALPMSIDTLVLYYNSNIFNDAGIATYPGTWIDFKNAVKAITKLNEDNKILRSAVAMGRSDNVDRSVDLLSVLMMQNGAQMIDASGRPTFNITPHEGSKDYNPGSQALIFYTDFANPIKEVYTWNEGFSSSLEAFAQGQTAMMFGYSYHEPLIKARGPKINFKIAPLPQIDPLSKKYNFANYWTMGISKKGEVKRKDTAWDFLLFATTKSKEVEKYLKKSNKAPALRELIEKEIKEPLPSPFATQVLTAKSWYRGYNSNATEEIMKRLISNINKGNFSNIQSLLNNAVDQIKQTYIKPSYAQ